MNMVSFGRDVCNHLADAQRREWVVTNGIGGFASGTVAGLLTRRYHGYLLAALKPPLGRTLLLAKLDETVEIQADAAVHAPCPLYVNHWAGGEVEPQGYHYLDQFRLEGTTPVWTFSFVDSLLEKRIWMQPEANTTYIQYQLLRGTNPVTLQARAFVNYRDYHGTTIVKDWRPQILQVEGGLQVSMFPDAVPFYLLSDNATLAAHFEWYEDFYLGLEEYRGQNDVEEDHLYGAQLLAELSPGETVTLVASTDRSANLDGDKAYAERLTHEQMIVDRAMKRWPVPDMPETARQLVLAADQFVVRRATAGNSGGRSIIAGYHWFGDWGRDTMIALPGLTLATGRPDVTAVILRTFAEYVDSGMLPNRFPDEGEAPEYNTADATLWYFEAIRAYYKATNDEELLRELFPTLDGIIAYHKRGTRFQIHMDDRDSLIYAGEPGVQLTWMDAKVEEWVVTPRIGKPVEINALWYNALHVMGDFARVLGYDPAEFDALATSVKDGFGRFWNGKKGYCYDVLDGPGGHDDSLRPNQLLAISLRHSPLSADQQRSIVDVCANQLLTPHGLRSLSPNEDAYIGHYGGNRRQRDAAYHQGTVWAWLIGPFVSAHLRVYRDPDKARSYLRPLLRQLADHGVGSISEIFDGDAPFFPRGCIAQAWSVAELLRAWQETLTATTYGG